jgi:adenylate kinase
MYCELAYILPPFGLFMQPLRIAVSGVPGCGKTSLCEYSKGDTISVLDLAKKHDTIIPETLNLDTVEIDVELLNDNLVEKWKNAPQNNLFIDGHLSHHLPVDCIVLLRCRPDILENRLKTRNWTKEKISENVEFELLSSIINELDTNISTLEIDTTNTPPLEIFDEVNEWIRGNKETRMLEIDWIAELHS